jgi:hypothetical protein
MVVDGITCTGPLRLMIDLGAVEPKHVVEDVLDRAEAILEVLGMASPR